MSLALHACWVVYAVLLTNSHTKVLALPVFMTCVSMPQMDC